MATVTPEMTAKLNALRAATAVHDALQAKRREIMAEYKAAVALISAGYDVHEIDSWPQQSAEAHAYTLDAESSTPLLSALATEQGLTVSDVAAKVLLKESIYKTAYGVALGRKKSRLAALAAIDPEAPDALEQIGAV